MFGSQITFNEGQKSCWPECLPSPKACLITLVALVAISFIILGVIGLEKAVHSSTPALGIGGSLSIVLGLAIIISLVKRYLSDDSVQPSTMTSSLTSSFSAEYSKPSIAIKNPEDFNLWNDVIDEQGEIVDSKIEEHMKSLQSRIKFKNFEIRYLPRVDESAKKSKQEGLASSSAWTSQRIISITLENGKVVDHHFSHLVRRVAVNPSSSTNNGKDLMETQLVGELDGLSNESIILDVEEAVKPLRGVSFNSCT